jgi:hypothetical protein
MLPSIGGNGLGRDRRRLIGQVSVGQFVVDLGCLACHLGLSATFGLHCGRLDRLAAKFAHLLDERAFVRVAPGEFGGELIEHLIDLIHAVAPHPEGEPHAVDVGSRKATVIGQIGRLTVGLIRAQAAGIANGEDGHGGDHDKGDNDEQDGHEGLRTA